MTNNKDIKDRGEQLTLDDLEVDSFVTSLEDEAVDLLGGCTPCGSSRHCIAVFEASAGVATSTRIG